VLQGSYVDFTFDDDGNAPGAETTGGLGLIGLAYRFDNNLLVGLAYSNASANIDIEDGSGTGDFGRRGGLLWAEWQDGPLDLRGWLGFYDDSLDARRDTALGGMASADVSASETSLAVEARHWMDLRPDLEVSPILGLEASWIDQDPYTETGGGAENFSAEATSRESLRSLVGVDFRSAGEVSDRPVEWQAALGWVYEFGDRSTAIRGTYDGDPTQTVAIGTGPEIARSSLGLTLAATVDLTEASALRLSYTAANAEDWLNQAVTMRLSVRF
jgi:outer membrane autotransporter protein